MQAWARAWQASQQEAEAAYQAIDALVPFMNWVVQLNQEIHILEDMVNGLLPFVDLANIWLVDAANHEHVLNNVVLPTFHDPEFLVYWAFSLWKQAIQHDGQGALDWIGDEYLQLLDTYEQRYMAANNGQHSPAYFRRQSATAAPVMGGPDAQTFQMGMQSPEQLLQLQAAAQITQPLATQQAIAYQQQQQIPPQYQQAPPMPPIPGQSGVGGQSQVDQIRQRVQMYKNAVPDLATHLQRAHLQQRQAMGLAT